MNWISQLVWIAIDTVAGLIVGFVLYYFLIFKLVPVRPKSDEDAFKKMELQELLNERIQTKKDQNLDDSAPLPTLSLTEDDKKRVKKQVDKLLDKLLQPEYAIAQNCIPQTTYNDLKSTYDGYSDTALGLVFALSLLAYALELAPATADQFIGIRVIQFFATAALFIVALGSRDMFWADVRNNILVGIELKFDASIKSTQAAADAVIKSAKDDAKSKASDKKLKEAIEAELKDAVFSFKGLKVGLEPPQTKGQSA